MRFVKFTNLLNKRKNIVNTRLKNKKLLILSLILMYIIVSHRSYQCTVIIESDWTDRNYICFTVVRYPFFFFLQKPTFLMWKKQLCQKELDCLKNLNPPTYYNWEVTLIISVLRVCVCVSVYKVRVDYRTMDERNENVICYFCS